MAGPGAKTEGVGVNVGVGLAGEAGVSVGSGTDVDVGVARPDSGVGLAPHAETRRIKHKANTKRHGRLILMFINRSPSIYY